MTPNEIAKRLRDFREEKGWTEETFASKADISQSHVSKILRGNFKLTSKNVRKLCQYAKLDVDLTKGNPADNPDLMDALDEVWDGTPRRAKALARVIRSLRGLS